MNEMIRSGLEVAAVGITVVFSCLGFLALIMYVTGSLFQHLAKKKPETHIEDNAVENISEDHELDEETVAVISAAISTFYSSYKIKHIKFLRRTNNTWQSVGRMGNMRAHQFDKKSGR